ncbi:MAG: flavohemoglobin expression-modulating QEGLA motif protein, partial [Planctomycetes bacterium]|nr:flavohemoglobin expression-modulating QEGLA motif protein [Planctomycetota bacterium]
MSTLDAYHQTIRELSDRLVEAQRPIRVLDAIKWDAQVQEAFFASKCRELPPVDRDFYAKRPLPFDPEQKREEFQEIDREINRRLGQFSPVGAIMRRMCREYRTVVRMLEARGTAEFSRRSQELYGSANDAFHAGDPTLADLGEMMSSALTNIDVSRHFPDEEKTLSGEQAVKWLQERLDRVFPDPAWPVRVILSDGIISDA